MHVHGILSQDRFREVEERAFEEGVHCRECGAEATPSQVDDWLDHIWLRNCLSPWACPGC